MIKKKALKKKQTHISTKVGISIIVMVTLLLTILFISQYNKNTQTQTVQTHAAKPKPTAKPCIWVNKPGVGRICRRM